MRSLAPHGTRTRYIHHGCRCAPCKESNHIYTVERRRKNPHPNALVPAHRARKHLIILSRHAVGLRAVRDVTGMSFSRLREIRAGQQTMVTLRTERRILAVTSEAHADSALIPGAKTAGLVVRLRRQGFTYEQLGLKFDMCSRAIMQLVKRKGNVRAKTQMKVEKFYNRLRLEATG